MKSIFLGLVLALFCFSGKAQTLVNNGNNEHLYSVAEMQQDFTLLRKKLEKYTPTYTYTPPRQGSIPYSTACTTPLPPPGYTITSQCFEIEEYYVACISRIKLIK